MSDNGKSVRSICKARGMTLDEALDIFIRGKKGSKLDSKLYMDMLITIVLRLYKN